MTELISLTHINREQRQRRHFDEMKLVELADSIVKHGLFHAIVLREKDNTLVAGDRRTQAVAIIYRRGESFEYNGLTVPSMTIPATHVSPTDELQFREMELHENLQREDLSWQELASAHAELHELRQLQTAGTQTVKETASELKKAEARGSDITELSSDILLAQNFNDEDVVRAGNKREALKVLALKKQKEKNIRLAEEFDIEASNLEHRHTLIHGDAIQAMSEMTPDHFDVIITDPPYGVGADTFGSQTRINHEYDDSFESWRDLMVGLARESYRIAAVESHAYIFCDIRNFFALQTRMELHGWSVWPRPLIWDKGNTGTLPRPEHGPRLVYESILFASKGDKRTTKVGHDIIRVPAGNKPRHAAEKPVDLYIELLSRSIKPGDKILDPFAGSGPVFPAANRLSLTATGIELEEVNIGIASSRLEEK